MKKRKRSQKNISVETKQLETQKELLKVSKKHLGISKEHKEISEEHKDVGESQLEKSMSKEEQRNWYIITIVIMILIAFFSGGIFFKFIGTKKVMISDYDIKVEVEPSKIKLNENEEIDFNFKFTNVGKRNITDFRINTIRLYRIQNYKYIDMGGLSYVSPYGPETRCTSYTSNDLYVGGFCSVSAKMHSCPSCFDDKDKTTGFFIYIKSNPPIKNEIVNLTIY